MNSDEIRLMIVKKYNLLLNRNLYNQNLRNYCFSKYRDGNYYSDCSSSISHAYKEAGYSFGILNTVGMYQSKLFTTVDVKITSGQIDTKDISKLRVGDMFLYAGIDPNRAYANYVGHVEMVYSVDNQRVILCGHPSAKPRLIDMVEYNTHMFNSKTNKTKLGSRTLLCVKRFIQDDENTTNDDFDNLYWTIKLQAVLNYINKDDRTFTNLDIDGEAGTKTLNATPTLNKGSKGYLVELVQDKLVNKYGYDLGKFGKNKDGIDGEWGAKMDEAVLDFQKKYVGQANPDAIITGGKSTWKKLLEM